MMLKVFFFVASIALTSGRQFRNPVLGGADYPDPGVILVNGQYYAVTTTNNNEPNKYPIHVSNNLQDWVQVGFVFTEDNLPVWSTKDSEFWAPEIHQIGENEFRVYFTSRDTVTGALCIGAAYSNNVLGPYTALPRPLQLDITQDNLDCTLVQDNGTLYFIWKGREWMYGNELNSDGLSFKTNNIVEIMRNDLPWEESIIEAPWVVKRGDTFYMFYSGNGFCVGGDKYAVGVAKATHPFGPYTKRGDPILASNNQILSPGHCTVVKDVDGVGDVMVFHGYPVGLVCPNPRLMMAQSVGWGADGWPYMISNSFFGDVCLMPTTRPSWTNPYHGIFTGKL